MKRRKFFRAMAAAPLAPALIAQQTNNAPAPTSPAPPPLDATTPPAPLNRTPSAAAAVKIDTAVADEVADMKPKFFNAAQFACAAPAERDPDACHQRRPRRPGSRSP